MKIDIYTHIVTPRYLEATVEEYPEQARLLEEIESGPCLRELRPRGMVLDKSHPNSRSDAIVALIRIYESRRTK